MTAVTEERIEPNEPEPVRNDVEVAASPGISGSAIARLRPTSDGHDCAGSVGEFGA